MSTKTKKKYSPKIQGLLKQVVDECDKEDRSVRERQIRTARQLKLFWENFQRVWYSEIAHDWRVWDLEQTDLGDQGHYDKPVNVFRAYLESIIAALSVTVPGVKAYPDDADNTLDLLTARAGDKIAELVGRHNNVQLTWLHALFIYCTEGMIAARTYAESDKAYGTYEVNNQEDVTENHQISTCPNCGHVIDDQMMEEQKEQQADKFAPDNEDVVLDDELNSAQDICPSCLQQMTPNVEQKSFIVTRIVGKTQEPKTRICIDSYGLLNVKVPVYAKAQCDCPYLIFAEEINYTQAIEEYEDLARPDLLKSIKTVEAGGYELYDMWARLSPQYQGEYPTNVVTRKEIWLRPCSFNFINNKEDVDALNKEFPDGAYVCMVNDTFAEACNASLDDEWTLTKNPLSDFIHFDPAGMLLVSIQEITNDLISLTLQTIEHGISQTFVDPAVLNLNAYGQTEVTPGGIFPATPKSGKSLGDGFYELKTATLSQEVMPFSANIQQFGQLASGATPSIFGGQLEGSNTASEYSMSRAQAQQRLQNTWKMLTSWWKEVFGKVIPLYIKEVKHEERDVQLNKDGKFFNVFITRAELEGKIGKIELDASENIPLTWNQKKDVVMNLLQVQNEQVTAMLMDPNNVSILREAIGLNDFTIPGEDDVDKQHDEIIMCMESQPIDSGQVGPDGQPQEQSSVDIDIMYDNHQIHFGIVRKWAVSEAGRQAKVNNQAGYTNVLLHGKAHQIQMMTMAQSAAQEQQTNSVPQNGKGAAPSAKPKQPSLKSAPIQGENNVATVQ